MKHDRQWNDDNFSLKESASYRTETSFIVCSVVEEGRESLQNFTWNEMEKK